MDEEGRWPGVQPDVGSHDDANVLPWAASEDWAASTPGDALTPRSIATARIPRSSYNVYALSVQRQLTHAAARPGHLKVTTEVEPQLGV
jgi:hypothetical protein